jgi:AmmeMemoRadiSam system protein B
MYRWWGIVGIAVVASVAATWVLVNDKTLTPLEESDARSNVAVPYHRSYSNDASLYAIVATSTYSQRYPYTVAGGIVSHHLLANIDISRFFAEFTDQAVCRVVIVGPNHYFPGGQPVTSTYQDYETPFGVVKTDAPFVQRLVGNGLITIDEGIIEEEHSISSLVPYVAAYFPQATVVPLILNQQFDVSALAALADGINENSNDCTIVVASVDFSHHLYSNMSALHDRRTVVALTQFDYVSFPKLEVDSRSSLAVVLQFFAKRGAEQLALEQQSSANIFDQYDSEDVTSYVFAHALPGTPIPKAGVSALFFGDMMLGRGIAERPGLWSGIRGPEGNFMKGYDAIVGNIEGAIARPGCDSANDDLLISPTVLKQLRVEGVTHGGVMNNHFLRCPYDALAQSLFDTARITPIATTAVAIVGTKEKITIVAVYASPVPADITAIVDQVRRLDGDESVVVYIHWGAEYMTSVGNRERTLAHALIDAGADAVIGHHPHVVQPIEVYKNVPIFYSLGNLFSDQVGPATRQGYAVGMWSGDGDRSFYLFPYENKAGIPTHLTQAAARAFCADTYRGNSELVSSVHPCILNFSETR